MKKMILLSVIGLAASCGKYSKECKERTDEMNKKEKDVNSAAAIYSNNPTSENNADLQMKIGAYNGSVVAKKRACKE